VVIKAFSRRNGAVRTKKGKNKEMPPEYAAVMIQRAFKAYLIRRSKSLRALRDLAIAKTKLKELRASFHNFSYRRLIARDGEERQKFSEKIIVLLLTVDAIEVFLLVFLIQWIYGSIVSICSSNGNAFAFANHHITFRIRLS